MKRDRVKDFFDNLEPNENRKKELMEELQKVSREDRKPKLTLIKGGKS